MRLLMTRISCVLNYHKLISVFQICYFLVFVANMVLEFAAVGMFLVIEKLTKMHNSLLGL